MNIKSKTFDVADFLDDQETIAEYLNMALEDPNPEMLLLAVKNIARARGMAQLAEDAGLGRESLYKDLSDGAKPRDDVAGNV
ncbi:addiction module antidote protein [Zwartia sp.]|uniref:addiction module antidote protein n=1 Tax=Zwartia sp. TaxID=2978004 RepID=UPI002726681F|nr:addiction module antidote protein [Zwartia sp.]MDO9023031.1 putative addiction module antidote protein [Zwartia sp.]